MASNIKQTVIDLIQRLPDDVSLEEVMQELHFRQKVDKGLAELDAGKGIDHEEARRRVEKWLA